MFISFAKTRKKTTILLCTDEPENALNAHCITNNKKPPGSHQNDARKWILLKFQWFLKMLFDLWILETNNTQFDGFSLTPIWSNEFYIYCTCGCVIYSFMRILQVNNRQLCNNKICDMCCVTFLIPLTWIYENNNLSTISSNALWVGHQSSFKWTVEKN